jgi:predicted RNase H-like nuclease (RuvC/YqgF family)
MAMTPKEKAAYIAKYNAAMKDPKNRVSGEIITPGSIVRGVAKVAAKVTAKKVAQKAAATAKATQGAKITTQQKATVASKTKVTALEKQIKELETQMKSNAARVAELAKAKKAPGSPDRTSGLLEANKKLAADLKKARQSYNDAKSTF